MEKGSREMLSVHAAVLWVAAGTWFSHKWLCDSLTQYNTVLCEYRTYQINAKCFIPEKKKILKWDLLTVSLVSPRKWIDYTWYLGLYLLLLRDKDFSCGVKGDLNRVTNLSHAFSKTKPQGWNVSHCFYCNRVCVYNQNINRNGPSSQTWQHWSAYTAMQNKTGL